MKTILIVEDDAFLREELKNLLEKEDYKVELVTDFSKSLEIIMNSPKDLILLDLNLPGQSGFSLLKNLEGSNKTPVLVLTSRSQIKDEVTAIRLGADDYITKPFRKERLLIRLENIFKRYEIKNHLIEYDDFVFDKNSFTIYRDNKTFTLPQNQGKLLEIFLQAEGKIVTKEVLSQKLWGSVDYIDENTIRVNITRLKKFMKRAKLRIEIKAERGRGYKLMQHEENEK